MVFLSTTNENCTIINQSQKKANSGATHSGEATFPVSLFCATPRFEAWETDADAFFITLSSRAATTWATGDGSDRHKRRGSPERPSTRVHHAEERAGCVSPSSFPVLHGARGRRRPPALKISRFFRGERSPRADSGRTAATTSRDERDTRASTSLKPRVDNLRLVPPRVATRRLFWRRRVRHSRGHHRGRGRG